MGFIETIQYLSNSYLEENLCLWFETSCKARNLSQF